jgi:hypothetical protein
LKVGPKGGLREPPVDLQCAVVKRAAKTDIRRRRCLRCWQGLGSIDYGGECPMPTNIIERAYQLAPECTSLDELRYKLKKGRYSSVDEHPQGGSIQTALKRLFKGA